MTNPPSQPQRPVTIDEIAAVVSGEGGSTLEARVQAAADRDSTVAASLASFQRIAVHMLGDASNEPPEHLVLEAKRLGARLESRRVQGRSPFAAIGEMLDRAGAVVLDWVNPASGLALAGVRDDRGADLLEAAIDDAELLIRAERTPAQDGVVRLVGEVMRQSDETPVKARLAVLDATGLVLATDSTDSLGMFTIDLPEAARLLAVRAHAADGSDHPMIVLPLGPDGGMGAG